MARRKKTKIPAKYYYIAVIVISAVTVGKMLFSDIHETIQQADVQAELSSSPAGEIIADFENLGKAGEEAKEDLPAGWGYTQDSESSESDNDGFDLADRIEGTIVRVKDGDTYVINAKGEDYTVRLIGVDTPESVAPATYSKENTEEGKEVSDIVKDKLKAGDKVYIEFDVSPEDKYNRLLCYVYFEDGTMIQEWLLKNGYAKTMTIQPNSKYADRFAEIQHEAAENKVGLWNGFFEG